ncbi:hypothetical protein [Dongia deserti]|uniref:hypothetical protein n=1 Tax=Dongia deserti TaxID=2268030 RepID=UPI0013C41009|nr:hypothetical protein [Dongia deserti]
MALDQEGLPARSLLLLATALLLFGIGSGLVGYMAGERHSEQHAAAAIHAFGVRWDSDRGDAQVRFDEAIGDAAERLEKAAANLRARVSIYHGCGAICGAIAKQFGDELLRARDVISKVELTPLPNWRDVLQESAVPLAQDALPSTGQLTGAYSSSTVIVAIGLLCATVALCFGLACFTLLKLRGAGTEAV